MTQFNSLVRPFQLRESYTQPRRIVNPDTEAKPNIIFDAGKGKGNVKTASGSFRYSWRGYQKKRVKERKKNS